MIQYPIAFHASAKSNFGINELWNVESSDLQMNCAIPKEFEGPGGAYSPEDLFAQALTNCFIATFKVYAEKSRVQFDEVSVKSELIVDMNELKKPVMKSCRLHVLISGCENIDRTRALAERAFQSGFILNSVKTELKLELEVHSARGVFN